MEGAGDVAAGLWSTKDEKNPRVLLVSCYWDIFVEKPPKKLEKAVEFAKTKNYSLIVGMDSNVHTTLTGSPVTNGTQSFHRFFSHCRSLLAFQLIVIIS